MTTLRSTLVLVVFFFVSIVNASFELPLKTLILGTSTALLELPKLVLTSFGSNYDIVNLEDATEKDVELYDGNGKPRYNSIVLSDGFLGAVKTDGTFYSKLSDEKWKELHEYQKKFKVRSVILASSVNLDTAIVAAPGWEKGSDKTVQLSFMKGNKIVDEIRSNVKEDATFKLGQVNNYIKVGYWFYPGYLANDTAVNTSHIDPFMRLDLFEEDNEKLQDNNWIGAFIRKLDGREEMHFLVNANQFGHHGFVLADMWFPWLNRGLFIGQRRLLLDTQVDDVFLSTGMYVVSENRPAIGGVDPTYTQTATDVDDLAEYQRNINQNMPNGSRFIIQLAYNGLGWYENQGNNSMNSAVEKHRNEFFWLTHTWSHYDLYCPLSNCKKHGITTYNASFNELKQNADFAKKELFWDLTEEEMAEWPTWSGGSIVTPRISGLNNSNAIEAMIDNGLFTAVGDNSRPNLRAKNPFHTIESVPDRLGRTVTIIPRYPTRIYFDVSIPIQSETEHNSIYGPKCDGHLKTTPVSYPQKCNVSSFKYPKDLTIDEMLSIESYEVVRNLLNYRHDPYMFHQANLRFFTHTNGKKTCLMCLWIDSMLSYLSHYSEMPILTYKMDDLGKIYVERKAREECGIEASMNYSDTGEPQNLIVKGDRNKNCVAKITRTTGFNKYFKKSKATNIQEKYGPDTTVDLQLNKAAQKLSFSDRDTIDYMDELPFPAAKAPDNRVKNTNITDIISHTLSEIFELDKALKKDLVKDFAFLGEFIKRYENQNCFDNSVLKDIDETSERFSLVSLPYKSALKEGIVSYYRKLEEGFKNLRGEVEETALSVFGEFSGKDENTVEGHIERGRDLHEDDASDYIKYHYENFNELEKKLFTLPSC
eukprot:Awhi_evm1s886